MGGNDTLDGGAGSDRYNFDADIHLGRDRLIDPSGIDTLDFQLTENRPLVINLSLASQQNVVPGILQITLPGNRIENAIGGEQSDQITGNRLSNALTGGGGNDTLSGANGNDTLDGSNDNDSILGDFGDDHLIGNSGDDTLLAGDGNDFLDGDWGAIGSGNDSLDGGAGQDTLQGGGGNDTLLGGNGNDELTGDYASLVGDDWIEGGDGNDYITGSYGDDTLFGDAGNDEIMGGSDQDFLIEGAGNDTLTGGLQADVYIFASGSAFNSDDFGIDLITDFPSTSYYADKGEEKIALVTNTFTSITATADGTLLDSQFAVVNSDSSAVLSSAIIVYNSSNGYLFYNQNGSAAGLGAGAHFATLESPYLSFVHPQLFTSDFWCC